MGHCVTTSRDGANRKRGSFMLPYFAFHFYKRYICGDKRFNPYKFMFKGFGRNIEQRERYVAQNCDRFIDQHIKNRLTFNGNHQPDLKIIREYNAIIVGSDQVWRVDYAYAPTYFLSFTKELNIKRLAYAASFGKDTLEGFTPQIIEECKMGAKLLDGISVREHSGVELCKRHFGVEATEVIDPTMLLDKKDYLNLVEEADSQPRERILMNYTLDKDDKSTQIAEAVAKISRLQPLKVMPKKLLHEKFESLEDCIFPSVSSWIAGFRDAQFVVTDSFHGCVFSIIFNKPFLVVNNSERGSARFDSLLKNFGLESRMVSKVEDITDTLLNEKIDFEDVNRRREELKLFAKEWLKTALK